MAQYKKGDIVALRGVVANDYGSEFVGVTVDGIGGSQYVRADALTLMQPQFEVGDRASTHDGRNVEVMALAGSHVMVREGDLGRPFVALAADLARVEPQEPGEPDPVEPPPFVPST